MAVTEQISDKGPWMTQNFEGWRESPYKDTRGIRTVGWGFNMQDPTVAKMLPVEVLNGKRALTLEEAQPIYEQLYQRATQDAIAYVGGPEVFSQLDPQRQNAIVDMAYNMGAAKLAEFKRMQAALKSQNWEQAALEAQDSNWYKQVGNRSKHVTKLLREGSGVGKKGRQ